MANLLNMIENHRELWRDFYRSRRLSRVTDASADNAREPVTREEERFVKQVIQHLNGVLQAMQSDLVIQAECVQLQALRTETRWLAKPSNMIFNYWKKKNAGWMPNQSSLPPSRGR